MISRLACFSFIALTSLAGTAAAQAALDDDEEMAPETTESTSAEEEDPNKTMVGVGFRLRRVMVPEGLIELFVEDASGGSAEMGFGLEVARRKGDFEVQFGLEYDKIFIDRGYWVDKGDMLPQDEPDYVEFEGFGWVTAEVTFMNHTPLAKQFAIRYGGGAGIGVMLGDVMKTDSVCTSADTDTCVRYGEREPYNIPPVMLVVNAIVGVQIRPIEKLFINIEGGLRTLPFFGGTIGYYF